MITQHLSDEEIQQYVLDSKSCMPGIAEHIQWCEKCQADVANYQLLLTGIAKQEKPVFDFNLPELVLAKLPTPKPNLSPDRFIGYLPALIAIVSAGVLAYVFRGYLLSLFRTISPLSVYLIIPSVITILLFLCMDMYRSYQKKISAIDF